MNTRTLATALLALLISTTAFAANDELKKLDFLVGEWKGEGTSQMGPEKQESLVTEIVQRKVGGQVLLVEGRGLEKLANGASGEVVHDALGVISWDPAKGEYRFTAHANGRSIDAKMDVADRRAVWGFKTDRGHVRYTITVNDENQWLEVGEYSSDGTSWKPFFHMKLQKVK